MEHQTFIDVYYDDIVNRLKSLSYTIVKEKDDIILKYTLDKIEQSIMSTTNLSAVPDELHFVVVERVCGEFLTVMKNTNQLADEDIETIVKSIREGDTTITFDENSSPQAKYDALMYKLSIYGEDEILSYRKMRW